MNFKAVCSVVDAVFVVRKNLFTIVVYHKILFMIIPL